MKLHQILYIISISCLLFACKDDEVPAASIVGKWKGDRAEVELKPLGIPAPISRTDEDFNADLECTSNGSLIISDDGQTATGTYKLEGNRLTTNINFAVENINLSGTYTIQELTKTNLIFYIEKDTAVNDPGSGINISGNIKATLYFTKQ